MSKSLCCFCEIRCKPSYFKETLSRGFMLHVFSWIIFPQAPDNLFSAISNFPRDICKSRCTTSVNNTGGKFATRINDTCDKFATCVVDTGCKNKQQYQHAFTLKLSMKKTIYIYWKPKTQKRIETKYLKTFWSNICSICHQCRWLLESQISLRIKKFKWRFWYYQGLWGRWFTKNLKRKISWHFPLTF